MTQRREFLKQASLLAAGTVAAGSLEAQAAPQAQGNWDMSWTAKVTGKYRMVYDAPEIAEGVSLHQVRSFFAGYAAAYGLKDADLSAVLVIRHAAVPMVCGDVVWEDGHLGTQHKLKDPVTGEPTRRNPFVNVPPGAPHTLMWPDGALDTLISRGTIVLACDLALGNLVGQIAARRGMPRQDARKLVYDHLLPGVTRMPSGIFATSHAQQLGCGMMYAG